MNNDGMTISRNEERAPHSFAAGQRYERAGGRRLEIIAVVRPGSGNGGRTVWYQYLMADGEGKRLPCLFIPESSFGEALQRGHVRALPVERGH